MGKACPEKAQENEGKFDRSKNQAVDNKSEFVRGAPDAIL
jgi:hypothetical protein